MMSRPDLAAVSALCSLLGAMAGGSALGVREGMRQRPMLIAAPATPAGAAAPVANSDSESDPETSGDSVEDDDDDTPDGGTIDLVPQVGAALGVAAVPTPHPHAAGAGRNPHMVTSDDVPEGPAQGYIHGRPVQIRVIRLDAKPVEVHTAAAFLRMREAAQRDHVALRIVSGFRTMAHQQALYRAWRHGHGNLAAQPGQSNHQSGHALDLNTSTPGVRPWLDRNGRRFGFRRTVPQEAWHWEWWP